MKKFLCCFLCCVLLCPIVSGIAAEETFLQETTIPCEATAADDFVTGEIMVGMKAAYSGVNKVWWAAHFPQLTGITEIEDLTFTDTEESKAVYRGMADFHQLLKITISGSGKADVLAGVAALEQNEAILFAEPNFIFEQKQPVIQEQGIAPLANLAPVNQNRYNKYTNDPYLEQQYGIFLHNVDKVWNAFTKGSSSVVVGIVDSGISNHKDLSGNTLATGYNCVTERNDTVYTCLGNHGTATSSIVGAVGNNGVIMSGVCQKVHLKSYMIAKGFNSNGGAISDDSIIARAILKANVDKVPVLNISWDVFDNQTLQMVVRMYTGLVVFSAGNDSAEITSDSEYYSPCYSKENAIVVGSITPNVTKALHSNYSKKYVHIMALGTDVLVGDFNNSYRYGDGTSFAAPFVAGVAALLLSYDSTLTTAQLKQYILDGVQTSSNLTNYCSTGGYLDAYGAFLAMLKNKTVSVNLQTQQIQPTAQTGTIAMYSFAAKYKKPYARLTEIVIPKAVQNNMFGVDIEFTSDTIDVTLHVDAANLPKDTPLMEFHFITYYTAANGKANVSLQGGTHTNLNGDLIKSNVPHAKLIVGDVNGDNAVNATDQLKISQHISGSSLLTGNNLRAADVNGDFAVNAVDTMQVSKYSVGKLLSLY